jgi:CheY-like chemotaxis protein
LHLALILHELGTNARKYGALSTSSGRIVLSWTVSDDCLSLEWVERGGPVTSLPEKTGFGTTLIEQSVKAEGGTAHVCYPREGIVWNITFGLPRDGAAAAEPQAPSAKQAAPAPDPVGRPSVDVAGRRFLIVEDEPLVALLLADALEDAGASIVGPAASIDEALRFVEIEALDAAILDCNLSGRTIDDVASALTCRGVPFLFVSGYGREGVPRGFRDAPVLGKPFTQEKLLCAAGELVMREASEMRESGRSGYKRSASAIHSA